jgi:hypothetical protein
VCRPPINYTIFEWTFPLITEILIWTKNSSQLERASPLLALVNRGAKKSNSEIWHDVKFDFEVKLKLIMDLSPYN